MKAQFILSVLLLTGSVSAMAATPAQIAQSVVAQNTDMNYLQVKQMIIQHKNASPEPEMCCSTYFNGKQVQGSVMAAHGHSVCVPVACNS